jgi:hypothetical protein
VRSVALNRVGRIALRDLNAISEFFGRDFLPYPFLYRQPATIGDHAEADSAPDRFNYGDLHIFKTWFTTYMSADIRVECKVQYLGGVETPSLRIMAHRSGELGFLASQQPDDAVEVFTLSPFDLGPAVAGSVALTRPGKHSKIVIPEYVPTALDRAEDVVDDAVASSIRQTSVVVPFAVMVPGADVTMYATAQSHWWPARDWGLNRYKRALAWVGIKDDGEYLYTPDGSHATPVNPRTLADRIDRLIGEDVAALRESRHRFG